MVSVLLSASVERFSVSRMQDQCITFKHIKTFSLFFLHKLDYVAYAKVGLANNDFQWKR